MKLRQNARHWAFKAALTAPVVGGFTRKKLVDMHTGIFLDKAEEGRQEERREHLDALFDATTDTYVAALNAGFPEAEAREITHVQANFDFYNHGWTEMMEIPVDELEPHYERYEEFFEAHGITIDDPLGEFAPEGGEHAGGARSSSESHSDGGLPEAPATPEKLENPEHPHAEGGFADDAYVETEDGELIVGGQDEPGDVSAADAPGAEADE